MLGLTFIETETASAKISSVFSKLYQYFELCMDVFDLFLRPNWGNSNFIGKFLVLFEICVKNATFLGIMVKYLIYSTLRYTISYANLAFSLDHPHDVRSMDGGAE